ncbi:hypothetical protein GCM10010840_35590 [Deinococcus aerolatus]|uniref:HTH luxR-type domain-containing protein n=1 Tax=Deinococcus aerolatus TaxID=522487 RepID=A0ABQ2GGK1_9DEIO|nr:hypothetical protein GCM10010840_35590 [Deinococcus aerolatus]
MTRICEQLDGLPLALELAAARLRVVELDGLIEWLDRSLDTLADGPIDSAPHAASMRATLQWSVDLLTVEERTVFGTCGVFIGGFTLSALAAATQRPDVWVLLTRLAEHSLVHPTHPMTGHESRWVMLEPVRAYAAEYLETSGGEEVRDRHADYFLALLERCQVQVNDLTATSLSVLRTEDANMHAALLHFVCRGRWQEAWRMLADVLTTYWHVTGFHASPRRFILDMVYGAINLAAPEQRRFAQATLGALVVHDQHDTRRVDQAIRGLQDSIEAFHEQGDGSSEAYALSCLVKLLIDCHQAEHSLQYFERLRDLPFTREHTAFRANVLHNLGVTYSILERYGAALQHLEASRTLKEELHDVAGLAWTAQAHAWIAYRTNAPETAWTQATTAWRWLHDVQDVNLMSRLLRLFALLGGPSEQGEWTVRLLAYDRHLRSTTGQAMDARYAGPIAELRDRLYAQLGSVAFDNIWHAAGEDDAPRVLQAVDEWLRDSPKSRAVSDPTNSLTPRERDVLRALAQGATDKKIAQQLGISAGTVSKHVTNMLGKLDLRNRVELARWAAQHHLEG